MPRSRARAGRETGPIDVTFEKQVVDVATEMTGEKWTLVGVLFAAIVGAIKLWKPRIAGMIARDEAALAAAETERTARMTLMQQELEKLRAAEREWIQVSASQRATNRVALHTITTLKSEVDELNERLKSQRSKLEAARDQALKEAKDGRAEVRTLHKSVSELRAQVAELKGGG